MTPPAVAAAHQALLREGLSLGLASNDTRVTTPMEVECIENAFDRVMALVLVGEGEECWPWQGWVHPKGYGYTNSPGPGGSRRAHRVVYEMLVGPIPPGMGLDHTCHRPEECVGGWTCPHRRCVNPAHLEPLTSVENTRRSLANHRSGQNAAKTHCKWGHPLSGDNVRKHTHRGVTRRQCIACANRRHAEYRAAREATA